MWPCCQSLLWPERLAVRKVVQEASIRDYGETNLLRVSGTGVRWCRLEHGTLRPQPPWPELPTRPTRREISGFARTASGLTLCQSRSTVPESQPACITLRHAPLEAQPVVHRDSPTPAPSPGNAPLSGIEECPSRNLICSRLSPFLRQSFAHVRRRSKRKTRDCAAIPFPRESF